MSPVSPCVPIVSESELKARADCLRKLRYFATLHERLRDAQAQVQTEQGPVQRNQAGIERAQRSLDQANDKLTFTKAPSAAIQAEVYRESASSSAFSLHSVPSSTSRITSLASALAQMFQQATTSGGAVSLSADQFSSLASCIARQVSPGIGPGPEPVGFQALNDATKLAVDTAFASLRTRPANNARSDLQ